jgi:hypothetical protein
MMNIWFIEVRFLLPDNFINAGNGMSRALKKPEIMAL